MLSIRKSNVYDLLSMQECNSINLPENYSMRYYFYHALSWPSLSQIAEDGKGKVCGYTLGKLEEENEKKGHLTSVAVLKTYRKQKLAFYLITQTHQYVNDIYNVDNICLHVRISNSAALNLYYNLLNYKVKGTEPLYYGNKEDAYLMEYVFAK
ncbi:N-terminal acetyltransferase A complex catalytic subunit ARD1 [Plasmodium brasilianum]|uniref:N-acetyltransferase, putative n=2 Tax=Plasmodium (Plasmodium) TaxID=418103 RepID=A0A1A8WWL2_PLAMA|nr:N-terminal acetyltransferase A complex catalytic subunit ARD1, putative [Plasmodium malariae]KAI4838733.1 N-terminal acetyltransferase A complex catalytic subunit ARD1 [Plasmodium brasilianum]SBS97342.1 N-acetyltransferase, putative [Plasmodium malariae]SCN12067.1 N-terminal acetyltransferase A complex catalytic subunit ARD1, putative [Plasmodium malariae]